MILHKWSAGTDGLHICVRSGCPVIWEESKPQPQSVCQGGHDLGAETVNHVQAETGRLVNWAASVSSMIQEYEYEYGRDIALTDPPFFGVLAVLILRADTLNLDLIARVYPNEVEYVRRRFNGDPVIHRPDTVSDSAGNSPGKG